MLLAPFWLVAIVAIALCEFQIFDMVSRPAAYAGHTDGMTVFVWIVGVFVLPVTLVVVVVAAIYGASVKKPG